MKVLEHVLVAVDFAGETSDIFSPAREGLAEVCRRQEKQEMAERFREIARQIEESLAWRWVEADVRRNHPLWRRG